MRIEIEHRLDAPQAEVLAWHERPGALVRLTPPGLATPDAPGEGGIRPGRVVGVRVGPPVLPMLIRPHWVLRHVERVPGGGFVDQQVRGPWRSWRHEHGILDDARGGTLLRDVIDLELPRHLDHLAPRVERAVQAQFAFRARQLRDDLAFHARWAHVPRLTVVITGSSGLIGTQLAALLESGGHTVRRMVREDRVGTGEVTWDPQTGQLDPADLEDADVVVNLAGRSIATRWTSAARRDIRSSRIGGTTLISRTLAQLEDGPTALVQASAIGLYGPRRPGEVLTEDDPGGEGFLADLVRDWEGSTHAARDAGKRVVAVRTGMVLSDAGGSLLPQLPLFFAGVGGRLTAKRAKLSWITLDDITRAFAHAVLSADLEGPVNGVAPHPVTAGEFARTLGGVMHRPSFVPVPEFGPRLLLGRAGADELVRTDQHVSDAHLAASGFVPAHAELGEGLAHLLVRG